MKWLVVLAVLTTMAFSQSALVVPVSSADASQLKKLHQQMEDAEKAWRDIQEAMRDKYLVVDKSDPDASDDRWYPPEKTKNGWTISYVSSGSFITSNGTPYLSNEDRCDPKKVAEHEAWEKEQKQRFDEREAKSRRWRKGWYPQHDCEGCSSLPFEFSGDFKFMVPVKVEPPPAKFGGPIWGFSPTSLGAQ